jgi:aldehyde:ferredoxin oxidoreductase
MDEEGLKEVYRRNRSLLRAVNVRRGLRRADEKPPEDHWKKRFPELEEQLLDAYYKFKGWNKDGIPTQETLRELGLDYVAEDFLQRGILTDNGGAPPQEISEEKEKI